MQDKVIINDYIENEPLSEENLDKTLENVNKIVFHFQAKQSGFIVDTHGMIYGVVKRHYKLITH